MVRNQGPLPGSRLKRSSNLSDTLTKSDNPHPKLQALGTKPKAASCCPVGSHPRNAGNGVRAAPGRPAAPRSDHPGSDQGLHVYGQAKDSAGVAGPFRLVSASCSGCMYRMRTFRALWLRVWGLGFNFCALGLEGPG